MGQDFTRVRMTSGPTPGAGLPGPAAAYSAEYRRSAYAASVLTLALLAFITTLALALAIEMPLERRLLLILGAAAVMIVLTLLVALTALHVHRWSIEAAGLQVLERPKFALCGRSTEQDLPWADIAALRRVESATETLLEVERRGGAVHRMAQRWLTGPDGRKTVGDRAGLDALAAAIEQRLAASGTPAPALHEGLDFWNRVPGLIILALMLALSLLIAGAAVVAMFDGGVDPGGALLQGELVLLLLPVGVAALIIRSISRRARVRAQRAGRQAAGPLG